MPSHGLEACQAGDRLGVEAAEFRHLGQQARRGDARHARDRRQDLGPPGQPLVFGQPLPDRGIDGGQMPVELRQPMLVLLLQQPMPNLRLAVQGGGAVFDQRVARHLQFLTRSDHRLPGGALPEAPPGLDHLKAHSSPIVNRQAENGARGPVAGHAPVAPLPSCHKPGRTNLGPLAARPHLFPVPDRLPGRPTSDPGGPGLRRLYGLFSGVGVAVSVTVPRKKYG